MLLLLSLAIVSALGVIALSGNDHATPATPRGILEEISARMIVDGAEPLEAVVTAPAAAANRGPAAIEEEGSPLVDAPDPQSLSSLVWVDVKLQPRSRTDSLAGATVEILQAPLPSPGGETEPPLATVRIAQDNKCRVQLPPGAAPDSLIARVAQPGWCQTQAPIKFNAKLNAWTGRLRVVRGVTVRGRLVDSQGQGVMGELQIMARFVDNRLGGGVLAKAREDGRFELHATDYLYGPSKGRTPVLFGSSEGIGTAMLPAFDLVRYGSAPGRAESVEVRLTGGGVLFGRITDGNGAAVPAANLVARAISAGLPGEPRAPFDEILDRDGYRLSRTITAADGTFEFRGLRQEGFRVAAILPANPWEDKQVSLLSPEPVSPNGTPLELVFQRPALTLELLHGDGTRWTREVDVDEHFNPMGQQRSRWPMRPDVHVEERKPGAKFGRTVSGRISTDGLLVFSLRGSADVHVEILGGEPGSEGFLPTKHTVLWSDATATGQLALKIQATTLAPMGRVELGGTVTERKQHHDLSRAPAPFGTPLPAVPVEAAQPLGLLSGHHLTWTLLSSPSGSSEIIHQSLVTFSADGISANELPEGRYRWRISPRTYGETFFLPNCGGAEGVVKVVSGETTRVNCHVDAGSTVRVLVEGAHAADLSLERPDGSSLSLQRHAGSRTSGRWPPGQAHVSIVVASGSYVLVAQFVDSGVEKRIPVTLKAAHCTDVRVTSTP